MSAFILWDNGNDYRTTALRRVRGKNLTGKVVVVTGASGSLGKELAFAFFNAGATVICAGRNLEKLEKAKQEVMERDIPEKEEFTKIENGSMECMALDLGDYESIDKFVDRVSKKHPKIYSLVNNAGVVPSSDYKESKYGLESTFQANFVSTVVLTEKLIPFLVAAKSDDVIPRIVNVSSMSHADASKPVDFSKIPSTAETFGGYNKDYAESKWLLTCYTAELSRRFKDTLLSMSADPGASPDSTMWDVQPAIIRFLARYVFYRLTHTPPQAAGVSAHLVAADATELESGGYYQSGVLVPPLRPDCNEPGSWKKACEILKKSLPDDLKWCAKASE